MRTAGVQAQRIQRGQQLGHAQLQQRVGELQVGVYSASTSPACGGQPEKNSTLALSK
jgi:hypothetical protein